MSSLHKKRTNKAFESEPDPEFQVAPMADLLFVLLVFFMSITTTEVLRTDKSIDLPVAKDALENKVKSNQVVVNIGWNSGTRAGSIKVDDRPYPNASALIPMLKERINANPTTRVLVRADRLVEYALVSEIMEACSKANIANVTFSVMNQEVNKPRGTSL
jgi:biopolymer transport protein ExbD